MNDDIQNSGSLRLDRIRNAKITSLDKSNENFEENLKIYNIEKMKKIRVKM